jgi:7-cyano-7-deazaguanine synthase
MNSPTKAITSTLVVLSGGQDSATCLFWAMQNFDEVHAISFDYGQTHAIELDAAVRVAKLAGVKSHTMVKVGDVLKSSSPLTDRTVALESYQDFESMDKIIGDRIEKTFVPMRNAFFLTLAANHAIHLGVRSLTTGVCEADNANYPDCRLSFIQQQCATINAALGLSDDIYDNNVFRIFVPLIDSSKADTVNLADGLGCLAAMAFTHTAYDGKYPPTGKDHASVLRAHGFESAGIPDPLVLRAVYHGLMELPDSDNYSDADRNTLILADIIKLEQQINKMDLVNWNA